MLDTHARKIIQPLITKTANLLISVGFKADHITLGAFALGLTSSLFVCFNFPLAAVTLLWISGFLDAIDGTMARIQKATTSWGTLMDITGDRVVEIAIVLSLAIRFPGSRMALLLLLSSIIFSMTVFLTVGALSRNSSQKSFYYQAGLAERTEGFILFSLMIVFSSFLSIISFLFASLVIFTGVQRMMEAHCILKN